MQRTRQRFTIAAVWLLLVLSPPLLAGPLDRGDTGPQVNPATNDMLRVPGVVGMDPQSALAALQQAGVNPRIHTILHTEAKYKGQEGMVVAQMPAAGGMAMLGSSVSITVYDPGGIEPSEQSTPPADQYGTDGGTTTVAPNPQADSGDGAGSGNVSDNGDGSSSQLPSGSGWRPPVINQPATPSVAQPPVVASPSVPLAPKAPVEPSSSASVTSPPELVQPSVIKRPSAKALLPAQ